jgi:hypothetical protein
MVNAAIPFRGKIPVLGWSLHMTGGWRSQLSRVERWYERLSCARIEEDQLDFLFAFFESSLSLRDWLLDTGTISQQDMAALFAQHVELRLNRDLANSTKHHTISRHSQDEPPCLTTEYSPERPTFGHERRLIVLSEGRVYDALKLSNNCLNIWHDFAKQLD